ncbi:MAG: DMT family transporter [Desulfobacterales bacterium]|nr:DMT family transporter [Desulfobacterales bacterium]
MRAKTEEIGNHARDVRAWKMESMKRRVKHDAKQRNLADSRGMRPLMGVGLLLISGFGFSGSILMASMGVKSGIGVNTSNVIRYSVAILFLFAFQKITESPIKIRTHERFTALALGVPIFMMGIGYLGATRYIPVSLAVLIFYTGPILIILISRFTEKEPITIIRLIAIVSAFLGLALALDVQSPADFHIRGVLFAFMAAVGMAAFVTISSLTIRSADPRAVNLHALFGGALLFFVFLFIMDDAADSISRAGLLSLCGSGLSVAVAYLTFYAGLKIVGPVKASMLLNIEPIFTIGLAVTLLGERLSVGQFVGAGFVIAGIILINYKPGRA